MIHGLVAEEETFMYVIKSLVCAIMIFILAIEWIWVNVMVLMVHMFVAICLDK